MDIGFRAFFGCNLTYTTHNSVNYIGNPNNPYLAVVSVSDKTLVTYSIESSTKFILDSAFEACINLNSIILPSGLKTIGSNAFWGCSSLTSINIPKSVIAIEAAAFLGCSDLTEIRLPDSSIRVLNNAFGDATIYCKNPKNIWKWSFGQNYNNIIWED